MAIASANMASLVPSSVVASQQIASSHPKASMVPQVEDYVTTGTKTIMGGQTDIPRRDLYKARPDERKQQNEKQQSHTSECLLCSRFVVAPTGR